MNTLLVTGDQVEIIANTLPEVLEAGVLREWGATIERNAHDVRIVTAGGRKREVVERLWLAGCDVQRLNPVKSSLEDLYMKLVGKSEAA